MICNFNYLRGDEVKCPTVVLKLKRKYYIGIFVFLLIIITFQKTNAIQNMIGIYKIKPLQNKTIAIDPGHGGIDGGTYFEDILEKDISLKIGLKLKEELEQKGATVVMTREIDDSLDDHIIGNGSRHREDLVARTNIVNVSKTDILISIHVNYSKNKNKMGPIIFYYTDSEISKILAEYLQDNLNNISSYKKMDRDIGHIVTPGNFYVLRNSEPPGVIVETGFLSNEIDRDLLLDIKHQEEIVRLIGKSIIEYFNKEVDMTKFNLPL